MNYEQLIAQGNQLREDRRPQDALKCYAQALIDYPDQQIHLEADLFFIKDGEYKFDPKNLANQNLESQLSNVHKFEILR